MRRLAVSTIVLAACAFPTKPGDPFACNDTPLPATAPASIRVTASVIDPIVITPLQASLSAFVGGLPVFSNVQTDAGGHLTETLGTGGGPHEAFMQSTVPDYVDSYLYPALPVAGDIDIVIQQFKATQLASLGAQVDATHALMIVAVADCNDHPVAGAMVSVGSESVIYLRNGMPDPTATTTDAATGAVFVVGLTDETPRMVNATLAGVDFQAHAVTPHFNAVTLTEVSP